MKYLNLSLMTILTFLMSWSCEKNVGEQTKDTDNSIKNIYVYSENSERGRDVFDISYNNDMTIIYLTTPAVSTAEDPVNIAEVIVEIEVAEKAKCSIQNGEVVDFSKTDEVPLTVTAENGDVRNYTLHLVVTPPYEVVPEFETKFEIVWQKSGTDMNMLFPRSAKDIAISGDYFLILDNNVDMESDAAHGGEGAKIKVYDKKTGDFIQIVPTYEGGWTNPSSYMWSLCGDEAGHFAMGRLNSGGAGCRVDIYSDKETYVTSILRETEPGAEPNNLPANLGKRMQILGDITKGNAMIVMTAGHYFGAENALGCYATWELKDGVPVSAAPSVITTAHMWNHAIVQRASLDDPTMYIAYTDETGYATHPEEEWDELHAAHFEIVSPGKNPIEVKSECFDYRIIDMEVFDVLGGRFMASLQQTYSTAGAHNVSVYNFTDTKNMTSMTPDNPDFDKFRVYKSEERTLVNDLRYGNVVVDVDETENCAYIYSFIPGGDIKDLDTGSVTGSEDALITCMKMTVNRIN